MMSDAYLEAAFESVGGMGRPLVLTHDPAAEARAAEIVAKWGAFRYRGPNGLNVDSECCLPLLERSLPFERLRGPVPYASCRRPLCSRTTGQRLNTPV